VVVPLPFVIKPRASACFGLTILKKFEISRAVHSSRSHVAADDVQADLVVLWNYYGPGNARLLPDPMAAFPFLKTKPSCSNTHRNCFQVTGVIRKPMDLLPRPPLDQIIREIHGWVITPEMFADHRR
jgi:hypothetical protein